MLPRLPRSPQEPAGTIQTRNQLPSSILQLPRRHLRRLKANVVLRVVDVIVRKVRVQQASLSDKPLPKGRPGVGESTLTSAQSSCVQDELLDHGKTSGVSSSNPTMKRRCRDHAGAGRDPASIALRIAAQEIRLAHVGQRISIERLQADEHIDTTSPLEPGEQLLVIG